MPGEWSGPTESACGSRSNPTATPQRQARLVDRDALSGQFGRQDVIEGSDAARYYVAFSDLVWGRVQREIHGNVTDPERVDRTEATLATLPDDQLGLVRRAVPDLRVDDEILFETELELFVAGVRHRAENR